MKLIDHWTSSRRAAEMSGRMQAGTEASRYSGGSGRKSTSSGRMMLGLSGVQTEWHVVRTARTCGQMSVRTGWHVVRTVVREPIFLDLQTVQKLWNTSE
jgi:hypothetical protein